MRVTADVKERTRARILRAARELLVAKGFNVTTTRDIATRAGIASGTLFNYFPSKEALGLTLIDEALQEAHAEFYQRRAECRSLTEALFAFIMAGLRQLRPYREFVGSIFESSLSWHSESTGERIKREHLETVANLIACDADTPEPSSITMHLYWTLYLGVIAWWAMDDSDNHEDTLAMLDQSLNLFTDSLRSDADQTGGA